MQGPEELVPESAPHRKRRLVVRVRLFLVGLVERLWSAVLRQPLG